MQNKKIYLIILGLVLAIVLTFFLCKRNTSFTSMKEINSLTEKIVNEKNLDNEDKLNADRLARWNLMSQHGWEVEQYLSVENQTLTEDKKDNFESLLNDYLLSKMDSEFKSGNTLKSYRGKDGNFIFIFTNLENSGAYNLRSDVYQLKFENDNLSYYKFKVLDFDKNGPYDRFLNARKDENCPLCQRFYNISYDQESGSIKEHGFRRFAAYPCNEIATYQIFKDRLILEKIDWPLLCIDKSITRRDDLDKYFPDTDGKEWDFSIMKNISTTSQEFLRKAKSL